MEGTGLRSDARDNRDRVLEAARRLFSEQGLGVPMREIARRAEVGPATLYRRFPTKQALIDAAFADEMRACSGIVRDGCADPDPWRGLSAVVRDITELNAVNQGFTDAFVSSYPGAADFAAHRAGMLRALTGLWRRAQRAGAVRPDSVVDDLILMIMAGRGLPVGPPELRVAAARRFAALILDSFRASPAAGPLPPPARVSAAAVSGGG
ncbi:TetR/AcrR family transcriptional regulator [Actinoplanes sp. TRM 88003]|uniref:TetR/AcrR family transcriptional regulator n=1 Tax=Paractinoplanes aksuensis TaxID=2939490 RepID=A0ABT1DG43_9ACTN|nr:TetR/AcrR family transcriptional regulator [Actinoplanes aksuensis]MCO8269806.1 TetR/AcrR family transcriptional regulator [Actinoplanes aksuensis]